MITQAFSLDDIAAANQLLAATSPQEILRWAVEAFHPRLTMATAFGAEGCCLIHMLAEIEPTVHVFNLETGYQFPETLELRERIKDRYGIEVVLVRPESTVAEYEALHGGPLYTNRPDQCDRRLRCLDQRHPPRSNRSPGGGEPRAMGREVQPGEDQSAAQLEQARRLGFRCPTRRAL
jgi:hypothetical protein